MVGMPTIMPIVIRSRESWRTSFAATASRRSSHFMPRAPAARRPRAGASRRRIRPRARRRPRSTDALAFSAASAPRSSATGSFALLRQQHAQAIAELRHASHLGQARERAPRGLEIRVADLDHDRVDLAREHLGLAFRSDAAAVEDREPVAALRLVHVVRRDEDRRPARDEREQVLPEIAPALRIDGARRLVEQQELRLVQRRGAEREPLALAAGERARALLRDAPRGRSAAAGRRCARRRVARSSP